MNKFSNHRQELIVAAILISVGILSRTVFKLGPNFELVTAITMLCAIKLARPFSILVPAGIVILSDVLIGNTGIFLFTWSGFAFGYLIGIVAKQKVNTLTGINSLLVPSILSLVSVLVFYFWTNFGVVIVSPMYPHTWEGYLQSLYMALPFLKLQLQSAILYTPIVFGIYSLLTQPVGSTQVKLALLRRK